VVSVDPRPSYEELAAENAELRAMVEALKVQVAELMRRLEQNLSHVQKTWTWLPRPASPPVRRAVDKRSRPFGLGLPLPSEVSLMDARPAVPNGGVFPLFWTPD
jgi:hypothetical protein